MYCLDLFLAEWGWGKLELRPRLGKWARTSELCRAVDYGTGQLLEGPRDGKLLLAVDRELLQVTGLDFSMYHNPGSSDILCGSWHSLSTKIEASRPFKRFIRPRNSIVSHSLHFTFSFSFSFLFFWLKLMTGLVHTQGERSTQECELWGMVHWGLHNNSRHHYHHHS